MVAWQDDEGSFWVSNTLVQSLSDREMIEIAKGMPSCRAGRQSLRRRAEKLPVSEREPIGVVGAGWVGLVTAACFAELGHSVVVREIVPEKVEALSAGELPIHEPGLAGADRARTASASPSRPRWASCWTRRA